MSSPISPPPEKRSVRGAEAPAGALFFKPRGSWRSRAPPVMYVAGPSTVQGQVPTSGLLRRLLFRALLLAGPHLVVEAGAGQEVGVGAALDDAAGFEDHDLVGVDHGRKPVGDDERGAAQRDAGEVGLEGLLGAG